MKTNKTGVIEAEVQAVPVRMRMTSETGDTAPTNTKHDVTSNRIVKKIRQTVFHEIQFSVLCKISATT